MNACQLQIRRDSIYKILKKKKKKEILRKHLSKGLCDSDISHKTSKQGDDLFGSFFFFHRAYYFKPRVSRVRLLALLVPAKCQSQETCQRRQMCRCVISSVYLASSFGCFRGEIWPNTKEGAKFPATGIAKLITARAPNLSQPFLREQEGLSR